MIRKSTIPFINSHKTCLCNTFSQKSRQITTENLFFIRLVQNNSTKTLSCLVSIFLANAGNRFPMEVWEMDFFGKLLPLFLTLFNFNPKPYTLSFFISLNKLLFDVE
eukprot:TRINITY_DN8460_c0_g1_i1.p2 TRINITY_DN8460_c0_g1~~TRINITY_DN8460_c0_g1_i1.p2  ORF type:complete len:107 (+),score=3.36 TRINITY_DN8460_c0_g1_i1:2869-3189(+)